MGQFSVTMFYLNCYRLHAWEKPTFETSPYLTLRGTIERHGGKPQHLALTFRFKHDIIIMSDI